MLLVSKTTETCSSEPLSRGFTLPELLMGMVIVAIIFGMALPALSHMVERYTTEVDMNNLRDAMLLAHSEAVARKSKVVVCPRQSVGAVQCHSGSLGNNDNEADIWKQGFLVFVDRSDSQAPSYTSIDAADGDQLVRAFDRMKNGAGFRVTGSNVSGQLGYVRFNSRGESSPSTASFLMCLIDAGANRQFSARTVLNFGRLRAASIVEAEDECDAAGL